MSNCVLLRYGEIGLKNTGTRIQLETLYRQALKTALNRQGIKDFKIKNEGGRFIIETEREIINILKNVPGIQSLSPAQHFSFTDKKNLLQQIKALANEKVQGKTFAVRVRRIGQHNFTSNELEREAGAVLYSASKGVNLTVPEITVSLEIREKEAYLYTETEMGLGGLPPASSGRLLALFSGGIDSPVAAFQMLKRGCAVDFLFVNLLEEKSIQDAARIYNYLIAKFAYNYQPRFYVIDGKELVDKIKKEVPGNLRQIALKIVFYQLGAGLAEKNNYLGLITGEALSQKSSQTLASLKLISEQSKVLILRPLISFDKVEITKIADRIGTLTSSEHIKEVCNLTEGPARTAPNDQDLQLIPAVGKEVANALEKVQVHSGEVELELEQKLKVNFKKAVIVNMCLDATLIPEAKIGYPYPEIMAHLDEFQKGKDYLIICEQGVQSRNVAFALQRKNIKAEGLSLKEYQRWKTK